MTKRQKHAAYSRKWYAANKGRLRLRYREKRDALRREILANHKSPCDLSRCAHCNQMREVAEFEKVSFTHGRVVRRKRCAVCRGEYELSGRRLLNGLKAAILSMPREGFKQCARCKWRFPIAEFDGLNNCLSCRGGINVRRKAEHAAERENLDDAYIKELLVSNSNLRRSSIPPELISLKRICLQIKRKLKEVSP